MDEGGVPRVLCKSFAGASSKAGVHEEAIAIGEVFTADLDLNAIDDGDTQPTTVVRKTITISAEQFEHVSSISVLLIDPFASKSAATTVASIVGVKASGVRYTLATEDASISQDVVAELWAGDDSYAYYKIELEFAASDSDRQTEPQSTSTGPGAGAGAGAVEKSVAGGQLQRLEPRKRKKKSWWNPFASGGSGKKDGWGKWLFKRGIIGILRAHREL